MKLYLLLFKAPIQNGATSKLATPLLASVAQHIPLLAFLSLAFPKEQFKNNNVPGLYFPNQHTTTLAIGILNPL